MPTQSIDLNADLGEGSGHDAALIPLVSSINLCCGLHAGSLSISEEVLKLARAEMGHRPLAIGAHPGLPDRHAMGRAPVNLPVDMLEEITRYQVAVLARLAENASVPLSHLKPHGALYHLACSTPEVAEKIVRVAAEFKLAVVGLPASALASACAGKVRFLAEGFAERGYLPDGNLIPRGQPGA
ncbi:MAG: LamB/YcsF family protein, partial [Gemmataceae bacterium]